MLRVESMVLRKIFGGVWGKNCIMRRFMICSPYQLLLKDKGVL
jgi:hypothetical protein